MDIKEIFARIGSGEVSAHSELGTRDEAKQSKSYASRLRKMKTTVGIKAHVLVMKDVVIPFNPFTCESDDQYNFRAPFRPILLVSQTLQGIKQFCSGNPEVAAKWEKYLGVEPGAIDWSAAPTMDDYFKFKARDLIKPRVMSYSTVSLNFGGQGGFPEYRQKYTVDPSQLDENNNYSPDNAPIWHKAAIFFNSMLKPEADEVVAALEKQAASKETITTQRRAVYSKAPVSFVSQTNLIPFMYFPMSEQPKVFDAKRYTDFESCIRWYGYNPDKWGGAIKEAMEDNQFDESMDFFDFTMRTPSSSETKSNGQVYTDEDSLELYQALTITNTDSRFSVVSGTTTVDGKSLKNADIYAPIWAAANEYFLYSQDESGKEGGDTFEKLMAASNGFRPITSVVDKLLAACNQVFLTQFANSKYFTPGVKKANAEFFMAMNPDNALSMADVDDDEIEQAQAEQKASVNALISEVRSAVDTPDEREIVAELELTDD